MAMLQHAFILIAAISGFLLSAYIQRKRSRQERLLCVIGEDCNKVVYSRYAQTFGIPNEILGMFYYGAVVIAYIAFLIIPELQTSIIHLGFKAATFLAALFSWYLISIQLLVLKEWCVWCIASSVLSTFIFLFVFFL